MIYKLLVYILFPINYLAFRPANSLSNSNSFDKIINGREASPGEFPYVAAFRLDNDFLFCAGSLVHPRWVLTTQECVDNALKVTKNLTITLNTDNKRTITNKEKFFIQKYIKVGKGGPPLHDGALILLTKPVKIANVNPVKMADDRKYSTVGNPVIIAGWGFYDKGDYPTHLRVAKTKIVPDKKCESSYQDLYAKDKYLCAGGRKGAACIGDSGGPLIVRNKTSKQDILVGLTSFGSKLCFFPRAAAFSRVFKVRTRIINTLKKHGDSLI